MTGFAGNPALCHNPKTGFAPSVRIVLVFLFCLPFAACAPGRELPPLPPTEPAVYRLGAGDVVRLITFGEDTLTGEFRVSDSGTIALPLIGVLPAAGLTPDVLGQTVGQALVKANLLLAPSVSVEVITYRPIFVLGEVAKPGEYPYQPGMTVVTAAAVAGGFTYRAIDDYAAVVRTRDGVAVEGKATRQTFVQPGDVITIFERRF
jgi:polysaccharide export outer membrane protein